MIVASFQGCSLACCLYKHLWSGRTHVDHVWKGKLIIDFMLILPANTSPHKIYNASTGVT